jgi:hypothetical protein
LFYVQVNRPEELSLRDQELWLSSNFCHIDVLFVGDYDCAFIEDGGGDFISYQ